MIFLGNLDILLSKSANFRFLVVDKPSLLILGKNWSIHKARRTEMYLVWPSLNYFNSQGVDIKLDSYAATLEEYDRDTSILLDTLEADVTQLLSAQFQNFYKEWEDLRADIKTKSAE